MHRNIAMSIYNIIIDIHIFCIYSAVYNSVYSVYNLYPYILLYLNINHVKFADIRCYCAVDSAISLLGTTVLLRPD